ncbi:MAG TPA: YeeE/YedE thiosulfate transporter family protein [Elusimicrobiota bacterium]|nr:YeeE/YedE thiosulfate transporter family protein [Elusimicrobiota bacterium]
MTASVFFPALHAPFPAGWAHYLAGGVLIGSGVSLIYVATGTAAGTSSFFSAQWSWFSRLSFFGQPRWRRERFWRLAYAAGLLAGAFFWRWGTGLKLATAVAPWRLLLGGLLAGFGTRLSGGCTAGHGICGIASLKRESFVAVPIFLVTAILVAHLLP